MAEGLGVLLKRTHVESDHSGTNHVDGPKRPLRKKRRTRRYCGSSDDEIDASCKFSKRRVWRNWHDSDSDCDIRSAKVDCKSVISKEKSEEAELPIGVIRGCSTCDDCQKVLGRWLPNEGRVPDLEEAPQFFPDEEEFQDPMKYIESIRSTAEAYGICRIVPPRRWRPPCVLKESVEAQKLQFATRVQRIDQLQERWPASARTKPCRQDDAESSMSSGSSEGSKSEFGFEPGSDFTIKGFEKYANDFKTQYFRLSDNDIDAKTHFEPTIKMIEGEYWRIVENATQQIEVLYGADVETSTFTSGFPKASPGSTHQSTPYELSGWNLNNIARLKGSLLAFEGSDVTGVVIPWLYIGMCFSSFCWHVEDHHLYSVNYMHCGSPKIWYGVPGTAAGKLETAMKKRLPHLFKEQPNLLHKLVTQLSPTILKEEGVPVFKVTQRTGDFVLTFPRAYHAGLNTGFNCAEAVNIAPMDWLPHGQQAVELYKEQHRRTSISHDKLLLAAAMDLVSNCHLSVDVHNSQTLALIKALKDRIAYEHSRRNCIVGLVKSKQMDAAFDRSTERECFKCFYDLHLSAIGCECSPERYSCLEHGKDLCYCPAGKKFALYRYGLSELSKVLEKLEALCMPEGKAVMGANPEGSNCSAPAKSRGVRALDLTADVIILDDDDDQIPAASATVTGPSDIEIRSNIHIKETQCPIPTTDGSLRLDKISEAVDISISAKSFADDICGQTPPNEDCNREQFLNIGANKVQNVEVVCIGRLVKARWWYNRDTIFPAGYKCRVKYLDYLNLPHYCYYICEILEGEGKPHFKVYMEEHPSEVFSSSSIDRCWQDMQERLKQEIIRRCTHQNAKFSLQGEMLSGIDMFGLSLPSTIQAIEALDSHHYCLEYWSARTGKQVTSIPTDKKEFKLNSDIKEEPQGGMLDDRSTALKNLFQKGSIDELWALHKIFSCDWGGQDWKDGFRALSDQLESLYESHCQR